MEENSASKTEIRADMLKQINRFSNKEQIEKTKKIEDRLFEFANFLEAKIVLMYVASPGEVASMNIIKKCSEYNKIVVLPAFNTETYTMELLKVDDVETELIQGPRGILEPDTEKCKIVPIDRIDIAIVPGVALDEKGERVGTGEGYYDRLIPNLSMTTRKVALAFEEQIILQVPTESHDRHVDIIITDERVIYKI